MSNSKVYFIKQNETEKIKELLPEFQGKLGLKCHFGEKGNDAFVSADEIKKVSDMVGNPAFLETTVLYRGTRSQASSHIEVARAHGFDYAQIDILDGEHGDDSIEVSKDELSGNLQMDKFFLGKKLEEYSSLLVVSHFKGHMMAGFGGAIKNLSMGLASRRGKLDMHAGVKHQVNAEKCTACGMCINNCPVDAIALNQEQKAQIDQEACISCSKCIAVCPVLAIDIPWGSVSKDEFRTRLAEYALAAVKDKQCFYINYVINIVPECDCMGIKQERYTSDIGILVSDDPVAIDQASYDLVVKQCPEFAKHESESQLKRAEEIGLGSRGYELVVV